MPEVDEAAKDAMIDAILRSARIDGNDSPVDYGDAEGLAIASIKALQDAGFVIAKA